MAKKKQPAKKTNKVKVQEKGYTDPTKSWWGKAIVWIIIFGMVGLILFTVIWAIIQGGA